MISTSVAKNGRSAERAARSIADLPPPELRNFSHPRGEGRQLSRLRSSGRWLLAAGQVHLVEVDGDVTQSVGAQVGRLVRDEVRAVRALQVEGVGVVLDVVLLVERFTEPGSEVSARRHAAWIVGGEGRCSCVGAGHPEL